MASGYKSNRKKTIKTSYVLGAFLVAGIVGFVGFRMYENNQPKVSPTPTATIESLPKSKDTSENKNLGTTSGNSERIGGPSDNNGANSGVSTSPSSWTKSQSGVITVKEPLDAATIKSGFRLTGTAKSTKVQYRLTDDKVGVISQGTVNVVDGDFSASIGFSTQGKKGRLDVFTTDNNDREMDEVQLQVSF